jgi:hypothetical protein
MIGHYGSTQFDDGTQFTRRVDASVNLHRIWRPNEI